MSALSLKEAVSVAVRRIGVTPDNFSVLSLAEREIQSVNPSARLVGYRNGVIYVEVESSAELYEIGIHKSGILRRLRRLLAYCRIESCPELRFFLKGSARPGARKRGPAQN